MNRRTLLTAAGAALAASPALAQSRSGDSAALTAYLDAQYEEELQMSPEEMTSQGRKDRYDQLTDRSEAQAADRLLAFRRRSVAQMKARFDPAKLDEEARTSFDVWALELERAEKHRAFRRHPYVFAIGGDHTGLPNFMITFHRVDNEGDMPGPMSPGSPRSARGHGPGAGPRQGGRRRRHPHAQVRLRPIRWTRFARVTTGAPFSPGPDSALFADGKAKIAALNLPNQVSDQLTADLARAMTTRMKPAYDRTSTWLAADRDKASPEAQGAGALPNGAAYYANALYLQTTTDMTAEQIHQLGLSEVARIRKEMEAVKAKTGYTGSLEQFFVFMRTDKRFYLPNTDEGRGQYLKLAEGYLAAMKKKLPQYFGRLPKADLIVKRVEAFREEPGGAQHYFAGTPDGSRPGIFYAHLSDMNAMPTYQLENIAYHEGLPGHHMQISIAQELTGLPKFRSQYGYTAYTEGWGLYSEALAKEMGFDTDPYNDFGRLSGEIWRAIRLVVDTGIHAKGWTEEQANAYFLANSSQPETAIKSEVRRYIVTPGQATCYKIGMLKLQQLRDRARTSLGPKFDYRTFHDAVLTGGSLPLPVLDARIDRWIAARRMAA